MNVLRQIETPAKIHWKKYDAGAFTQDMQQAVGWRPASHSPLLYNPGKRRPDHAPP